MNNIVESDRIPQFLNAIAQIDLSPNSCPKSGATFLPLQYERKS
ncbi:hypothetical protein [Calothrix sp. NIES-2098]